MINTYAQTTINDYLQKLSAKEPVPGGGSAAALSSAMGTALIQMATHYSLGKGKSENVEQQLLLILQQASEAQQRFVDLVTLDSQAFLKMRSAKKVSPEAYQQASLLATNVLLEIKTLSEKMLGFIEFLHREGNPYLLSDVVAAETFLKSGISVANTMIEVNS